MRYGELSNRLFCVHQPYLRFIFSGLASQQLVKVLFLFADLGLEAGSVKPCIVEIQLCSASRNAGSSAVSFAAFARTSTTSCGVFATQSGRAGADGEINAFLFNVGTSGMVFIRSSAITTSVFSLPPFTWLITSHGLTETASMCPPNRPVMAGCAVIRDMRKLCARFVFQCSCRQMPDSSGA